MRESLRHLKAFEYYYALGPSRTFKKVANEFNVSSTSITVWARDFNWEQRVYERETKAFKRIQDSNDEEMIKQMNAYKTVIQASISEYIKNLKGGKIKVTKVSDFAKLVELDLKLNGFIEKEINKDNNNDNNNENKISNETKNTLDRLFLEASRFGGLDKVVVNDILEEDDGE